MGYGEPRMVDMCHDMGSEPSCKWDNPVGGDLATIVVKKLLSGMILRVWATNGPTKGLGFWMWTIHFGRSRSVSAYLLLSVCPIYPIYPFPIIYSRCLGIGLFSHFIVVFMMINFEDAMGPPMKKIHQQECPSGNPHELGVSKTELFDDKPFF